MFRLVGNKTTWGEAAAPAQDEDVGSAQDSMSGSGWFELATT